MVTIMDNGAARNALDAHGERIGVLSASRWPADEARRWHDEQPWLCGFNFLPSTAVNFIDMWQAFSFDAETIERELGYAAGIGFNTLRTNLPFSVWEIERDGLLERIDRFLAIADGLGLKTMLCLMDDCGFSGEDPIVGLQYDPVPGVHNSRAVASPGRSIVMAPARWPDLAAYVRSVVSRFADDRRVLAWDLYNEPGNLMIFKEAGERVFDPALEPLSFELMLEAFAWCRAIAPTQPLTVAGWHVPLSVPGVNGPHVFYEHPIDSAAFALSDVVSFHAYVPASWMARIIQGLRRFDRPLFCTEWMARHAGSRIADQLPLLKNERVGAWQWGLVNGRTQTHIPWPMIKCSDHSEAMWFHDLLSGDGTPFDAAEIVQIQNLCASKFSV